MFTRLFSGMLRFAIFGLIWLFIFAIPVSPSKRVFQVLFESIVNTKPGHWISGYLEIASKKVRASVADMAKDVSEKLEDKISNQ